MSMSEAASDVAASACIALHRDGAVATIVLDMAQPRNSFRVADVERLSVLLDEVVACGARSLAIRGAGRVFSASWDIGSIDPRAADPMAMISHDLHDLHDLHEGEQLRKVFATADLHEGISAFQQRRKPVFAGR